MLFRKEKEYVIQIESKYWIRLICTKVTKDTKGQIVSFSFTNPVIPNSKYDFSIVEAEAFLTVLEPIDNCEFFQMYTNWLNFLRKGPHQDLEYAEQLRIKIVNTLKERTHVIYGSGAFIQYDLNNLNKLLGET